MTSAPKVLTASSGAPRPSARSSDLFAARAWPTVGEAVTAVGVAAAFTLWSGSIEDNPIRRSGQVSGLAALQLNLVVVALPVLVAVGLLTIFSGQRTQRLAARMACGALAGLTTGFLAGGQVFALRGTPWPINTDHGDNGALILMAREAMATGSTHSVYPPGLPYLAAFATERLGLASPALALKPLFIAVLALTGPAAYLAWRLTLGPLAALAVAVASVLPQVMPYKPYSTFVLVVLVPIAVAFLVSLRAAAHAPMRAAAGRGALFGLTLGVLFLGYSGWHVWAAPGLVVAGLAAFPWRRGRRAVARAAALLAAAGAVFLLITARYLWVLVHGLGIKDTYCSAITLTQPAYIGPNPFSKAQWDQAGEWPPLGWFAGLDLFTIVLLLGLGTAVALGLRRPIVHGPVAIFTGAWLMRFWIAHNLEQDRATQLFPRTTNVLQVCLCVLLIVAVMLVRDEARSMVGRLRPVVAARPEPPGRLGGAEFGVVGALAVLVLVAGMAGSALTDQYLPERPSLGTAGTLTWYAQQTRKPDGSCPAFAEGGTCVTLSKQGPLPRSADYATTSTTATFLQDCEYPWRK